jgi:hypothetical protein
MREFDPVVCIGVESLADRFAQGLGSTPSMLGTYAVFFALSGVRVGDILVAVTYDTLVRHRGP